MRRLVDIFEGFCRDTDRHFQCRSLSQPVVPDRDFDFETAHGKMRFMVKALKAAALGRPALVIVGHLGLVPVAWVLKRLGLVKRYGLVLHGIEAWRKAAWADRLGARGAEVVIATTTFTAREFAKHNGVRQERIQVIPLGLAESTVVPAPPPNHDARLRILSVGRLWTSEQYKGADTLIEAVARARRDGIEAFLKVAGDGDDLPRLKQLASRLGLLGCFVNFEGAVSDDRLQQLFAECDVFAMPSKGEGFGIVFLEAMRHAKPCIGGNHGGTPEVIDHGVNGYLVDHGDVEQLGRYLALLAKDRPLRLEMGRRACEKVASSYLFPHVRDRWLALLRSLVQETGCLPTVPTQAICPRELVRYAALTGLGAGYRLSRRVECGLARNRVQILCLHHVFDHEKARFRELLRTLSVHHRFITYSEAVERIAAGDVDAPYIAFSFDDGFRCTLDAAAILEEFGASACFFVCPSIIGEQRRAKVEAFCRERLRIDFAPEFLSWAELELLLKRGHEVGSHTMTHADLRRLTAPELHDEIAASYDVLRARLAAADHFAWPYGRFRHFTPGALDAVFEAGFTSCASAERGSHIPAGKQHTSNVCLRRDNVDAAWPITHSLYFIARNGNRAIPSNNAWSSVWAREFMRPAALPGA